MRSRRFPQGVGLAGFGVALDHDDSAVAGGEAFDRVRNRSPHPMPVNDNVLSQLTWQVPAEVGSTFH